MVIHPISFLLFSILQRRIILLSFINDQPKLNRQRELGTHRHSPLLSRFPFRHAHDDSHSFFIQILVYPLGNLRIGNTSVFLNNEPDGYYPLSTILYGYCRILYVPGYVRMHSSMPPGNEGISSAI